MKLQITAWNYTFLNRITNCIALDQSESSNFFMYMISALILLFHSLRSVSNAKSHMPISLLMNGMSRSRRL